jgi:glycosyltransferase involved in cell wall biosynthesis
LNSASPKVSVICTCYNHEKYVLASIQSVFNQTYRNYELIVVDDGSTDKSAEVIDAIRRDHPDFVFIKLERNEGICKAFNTAFKISQGDYVIDLAADDLLLPKRLERGVEVFNALDRRYGVIFSDAEWINEQGDHLFFHSSKHPHDTIPQGDVYKDLIRRYFICSPTMMFRRNVIERLEGYNENLTYEDFDFWIRSSRIFYYFYSHEVLVQKRKLKNSLSHDQFKILNKHNDSTFKVCKKIMELNATTEEQGALRNRLQYEMRQSLRTLDIALAYKYFLLWHKNNTLTYH